MRETVRESVRETIRESVRETVRESAREGVRETVRESVRETVRESVSEGVRDKVQYFGMIRHRTEHQICGYNTKQDQVLDPIYTIIQQYSKRELYI